MAIRLARYQPCFSANFWSRRNRKGRPARWLMYSSITSFRAWTMLMLRAVSNSRSSSQAGCAAASIPQMRLCSRMKTAFSAA